MTTPTSSGHLGDGGRRIGAGLSVGEPALIYVRSGRVTMARPFLLAYLLLLLIVPFGKLKQTGYNAYKSKRSYELAYDTLNLQASPPHDC
jgi:hypothetical protein